MQFLWRNKNLPLDQIQDFTSSDFFDLFQNCTLHNTTLGSVWHNQNVKSVRLKDRWFFYTGIIYFSDVESWLAKLDIEDIANLHRSMKINAQGSWCLITNKHVTLVKDFFGSRPLAYFVEDDVFTVTNMPGMINHFYGCHYNVTRNTIYTFSTKGELLSKSKNIAFDYSAVSTKRNMLDAMERAADRYLTHGGTCGLGLSSGHDSGMVDALCVNNSQHDVSCIATHIGEENVLTLNARKQYRKKHNCSVISKTFKSSALDSNTVLKAVEKYMGYNSDDFTDYIHASFVQGQYFAKQNCNTALIGVRSTYMHLPAWLGRNNVNFAGLRSYTPWTQFKFPKDMRLLFEDSLPYIDINSTTVYVFTDVVPYLLHGVDPVLFYFDNDIMQTFISLPQKYKNEVVIDTDHNSQLLWITTGIMNKYNYPYNMEKKANGPYVS